MKKIFFILLLFVCGFSLVGCEKERAKVKVGTIQSVNSINELSRIIESKMPKRKFNWFGSPKDTILPMPDALSPVPVEDSEGAASSKTNVQVEGVDEGDIVKNNGRYIYIANNVGISIIDTATDKLYSYKKDNFYPRELYHLGNLLIAYGSIAGDLNGKMMPEGPWFPYNHYNFYLIVLDITNLDQIQVKREISIEQSQYDSSRMIGEDLYFILSNYSIYDEKRKIATLPVYYDSLVGKKKTLSLDNVKII